MELTYLVASAYGTEQAAWSLRCGLSVPSQPTPPHVCTLSSQEGLDAN